MLIRIIRQARTQSSGHQGGFTLVELLVVIAILGILAAIVLFNINGVSSNAACNALKTDGGTIQAAVDIYFNNNGKYPDSAGDTATPKTTAPADGVNLAELVSAGLLHTLPATSETWAYGTFGTPANYSTGSIHGTSTATTCVYNP